MRKILFFLAIVLNFVQVSPVDALTIQQPEFQIMPTSTPTPTPTPKPTLIFKKVDPNLQIKVMATGTSTPTPALNPTLTPTPSPKPVVAGESIEPTMTPAVPVSNSKTQDEEKKLDQKEIIGLILIALLVVIIFIQSLWDRIKKPPTATSSEPE